MAEFMDLIETVRAEEASYDRLYGDAGRPCRSRNKSPQYLAKLAEALHFLDRTVYGSRWGAMRFQEAMGTADFPLLFNDILDRQLLADYQAQIPQWRSFVRVSTVPDFKTVNRFVTDGLEGQLAQLTTGGMPVAGEPSVYPQAVKSETRYQLVVSKYGRQAGFTWESMVSDDLNALKDTPARFSRAALRTEAKTVTGLYVGASGPNTSLYTTALKNIINTTNGAASTNPVLSVAGLQDALTVLGNQLDADGEPIAIESAILVVPPALAITARNLLDPTGLIWTRTSGGGTTAQELQIRNQLAGMFSGFVVDPYIPIVASSANGATSWFVFANPSVGRPALEVAFLRGHEAPELFIKSGNQSRGGGAADPMDGDFDTDQTYYKVRHSFGGARIDGKATVMSNGSGS